jgi:integrase/ribosomal protein L40E
MGTVHNVKQNLKSAIRRLKDTDTSERNRELILDFRDECYSQGLSTSRVLFYTNRLIRITELIEKNFDELGIEDIKRLNRKIEQDGYEVKGDNGETKRKSYSEWTKQSFRITLKKFIQWIKGYEWNSKEYPKSVKWLKSSVNKSKKLPEDLLTKEEVRTLIGGTTCMRDRALISVLYESGCRIGELLSLKIKHVEFDDYGGILIVNGKTGSRRIRIVSSVPDLSTWLDMHPNKDNRESPLWICIGSTNHGKELGYRATTKMLSEVAEDVGVEKAVNPHAFRHARATHLASELKEAQMKEYFGWTQASKMASTYVHLSGRDIDNAILKMHGIKQEEDEEKNGEIKVKECRFCHERNSFDSKYCRSCGKSLDMKAVNEFKQLDKSLSGMISPIMVEKMIEKKVNEVLAMREQE